MRHSHGSSVDGEVIVYVADVLRSGLVPADLRAALFQVLKAVPGADVTETRVRATLVNEVPAGIKDPPHHAIGTAGADNVITCSKAP